jgi:hypothetical protein
VLKPAGITEARPGNLALAAARAVGGDDERGELARLGRTGAHPATVWLDGAYWRCGGWPDILNPK